MNSYPPSASSSLTPVSELLDRIFRLLRHQSRPLLAVAAVPAALMIFAYGAVLAALYPGDPLKALTTIPASALISGVFFLAYALLCVLSEGAVFGAALQTLEGRRVTVRAAYATLLRRFGTLLWLSILRFLLMLAPTAVCLPVFGVGALAWYLFFGTSMNQVGWFLLIPTLLLLYLGWFGYLIYVSLRISLAVPAAIKESLTAREALRRSGELTRAVKGRIFLVALVVYAASYACFLVFCVLALMVGSLGTLIFTQSGIHLAPALSAGAIGLLALLGGLLVLFWIACVWVIYGVTFSVLYRDRLQQCAPPTEQ